jgi:hypothetical protein
MEMWKFTLCALRVAFTSTRTSPPGVFSSKSQGLMAFCAELHFHELISASPCSKWPQISCSPSRPVPFYVALVMARETADSRSDVPKAEWLSPLLSLEGFDGPQRLAVSARFPLTLTPKRADALKPLFRLREQLLMEMITETGAYQIRPGIVALLENG